MCGGQGWWVRATGKLLSIRTLASAEHMQRCYLCHGTGWREVPMTDDPDKCAQCGDVQRPCVCGRQR